MDEQQKELSLQANQPKAENDESLYFQRPSINIARKRSREQAHVHRDFVIEQSIKNIGKGKKYLIQTYGCQMNEHDSEAIIGIAEELGYSKAESQEEADLIILNTCAIRENAENRVFGELGRLKRLKRTNPDLILGVCGCMSQEEKVVNQIMEKYQYVDLVFGTHNIYRLPEYIHNALMGKERVIEVWSQEGEIIENMPRTRQGSIKAWVNIMYGCDEFCTYCIVPYTRGKERSRLPEDIIAEIQHLAAEGYQEVTLLGQNVNAYGKDFKDREYTFGDLLNDLNKISIENVYYKGEVIEQEEEIEIKKCPDELKNTVHVGKFSKNDLQLESPTGYFPVIEMQEGQITTKKQIKKFSGGKCLFLSNAQYQKIAVIERHKSTGKTGVGIVSGFGIQKGAIASSVSHDSHNIIVIGDNDEDMVLAVQELIRTQGGYTIVADHKIFDTLELPVMGLMSDAGYQYNNHKLKNMINKAHEMGVGRGIDPFITLSFMALPVIPEVRITPRGVYDVLGGEFCSY